MADVMTETSLTESLKELCNKQGTRYVEKKACLNESAAIFNKLSQLYKEKSPDKLSLIQSAVLINAAMVREQEEEDEWFMEPPEVPRTLHDLCSHVLIVANAKKQDANLVQLSEDVGKDIENMRRTAIDDLEELKPIGYKVDPAEVKGLENKKVMKVQIIQERIAESYTGIMKNVAEKCEYIMGTSPCKYTVVGMGSLARKEITPYSDFEHVIVLEGGVQHREDYEAVLEYFRWFTVIFQIIIINLQETIIPSVAIPCLNDFCKPGGDWFFDIFTTRGISFDGHMPKACKFPLGRMQETEDEPWTTELIQPVSGMTAFLKPEQNARNGYCLGDILTKTCFVSGDKSLYEEFVDQVKITLNQNQESNYAMIMEQIDVDLKNFYAYKSLHALRAVSSWNIKRVIYRSSTLFISALGQLHFINECSCFGIIDKLKEKNVLDYETARRLSYAVAIACQVRLQVYMQQHSQDDNVDVGVVESAETESIISAIGHFLGNKSLVDYFEITYSLQKAITCSDIGLNHKFNLKCDPITKFTVSSLFNFYDQVISEWKSYQERDPADVSTEDKSWIKYYVARAYRKKKQFVKALAHYDEVIDEVDDPWLKGSLMIGKAQCLHSMSRNEDAISYIEERKRDIEEMDLCESRKNKHLCNFLNVSGYCHAELGRFDEGLVKFKQVDEYIKKDSDGMYEKLDMALNLANMGRCLICLDNYDQGIESATKALQMYRKINAADIYKIDCYLLLESVSGNVRNEDKKKFKALKFSSVYEPFLKGSRLPR